MGLRPNIDGPLEEKIREIVEEEGFKHPVDYVRYCVRKDIERREERRGGE